MPISSGLFYISGHSCRLNTSSYSSENKGLWLIICSGLIYISGYFCKMPTSCYSKQHRTNWTGLFCISGPFVCHAFSGGSESFALHSTIRKPLFLDSSPFDSPKTVQQQDASCNQRSFLQLAQEQQQHEAFYCFCSDQDHL